MKTMSLTLTCIINVYADVPPHVLAMDIKRCLTHTAVLSIVGVLSFKNLSIPNSTIFLILERYKRYLYSFPINLLSDHQKYKLYGLKIPLSSF